MRCPQCQNPEFRVLETRASGDGIRRRRECSGCGFRFTTHERIELRLPLVVKKGGSREPFDRDKVVRGVRLACRKRPVTAEAIEAAAQRVEQQLVSLGRAEVPAIEIGRVVLAELRDLDPVAWLRFASVYLEVGSPSEFQELLRTFQEQHAAELHREQPRGAADEPEAR